MKGQKRHSLTRDHAGTGANACEHDHEANTEENQTTRLTSAVRVGAATAQPFVDVRSKATHTDAELVGLLHLNIGSARGNDNPSVILPAVPAPGIAGVQQTNAPARDGQTATKAQDTAAVVLASPVRTRGRTRRFPGMSPKSPSSASELAEVWLVH